MDQAWSQIVAEALAAGLRSKSGPVPGAKLRELVVKCARSHNLSYPPVGYEDEPFGNFLKHFDAVVLVRRRKGKDLLAAPVDMPHLLAEVPESGPVRIREDIFEAFTRIPRQASVPEPWYEVPTDSVVWVSPDKSPESSSLIRIPCATLEREVSDRKLFIQSTDLADDIKLQATATLDTSSGLGSFSKFVKAHGLSEVWHRYRFRTLASRIRAWCTTNGVPWREEWILSDSPKSPSCRDDVASKDQRYLFEQFVKSLTDEDLRRIAVPLDVVLKVIR